MTETLRVVAAGDHFVLPSLITSAIAEELREHPYSVSELKLGWPLDPFGRVAEVEEASDAEDELIEGTHRHRLLVPPGVTGLWQIFGSARIPMDEMVKIDYLYGANWSLWLDLKILLRTIPFVLSRRGL